MADHQDKNLHFSSLLAQIKDNGSEEPLPHPPPEPAGDHIQGAARAAEPAQRPQAQPRPRTNTMSKWLFVLLLLCLAGLAYNGYETWLRLSNLESAWLRLESRQENAPKAVDIEGPSAELLGELQLRVAELEYSVEIQRAQLQALQAAPVDDMPALQAGAPEAVADDSAKEIAQQEPAPRTEPPAAPAAREGIDPGEQIVTGAATAEPVSWSVILGSFRDRARANQMAERLASGTHLIEVLEVEKPDGMQYRVAVAGLSDPQRARELAAELQKEWGLRGLWVSSD